MFKFLIVLSLFIVIQSQIPGGFNDCPELINDPSTRSMVKSAVNELAYSQNLRVSPVKIVSVATQVVNGINYRIVFTARPFTSHSLLTCTARIYQQLSGIQTVSSIDCL